MNLEQLNLSYEEFDDEKTALVVTAFNRPDYLESVVNSLNECSELTNIPIFFFLDGGIKSKQKENATKASNLKFKNKFLKAHKFNMGCERNVLNSIYYLFEELKFENIFILEDDLVVCKNYFKYVFKEYKKINNNNNRCGMYQGWNKCLLSADNKKYRLEEHEINNGEHLWGYLLTFNTWQKIKPIVDRYYSIINAAPQGENFKFYLENVLYGNICNLYKTLINEFNITDKKILERYNSLPINPGQDEIISFSMRCVELDRYFPVVNRCKYIGKEGLHSTEKDFNQLNLNKVELDVF